MGMLVFSGVFERHPRLRVVCVEADAGWAPHFMYRMDHAYKRHRYWMKRQGARRACRRSISASTSALTFQDDWTAFQFADQLGPHQLMWANDFPHSDLDLAVEPGRDRRADRPSQPRAAQAHPARQRGVELYQAGGIAADRAMRFSLFMYCTIGRRAELEAAWRAAIRALPAHAGRDRRVCAFADDAGYFGFGHPEHHLQIEGFEISNDPRLMSMWLGRHCEETARDHLRLRLDHAQSAARGRTSPPWITCWAAASASAWCAATRRAGSRTSRCATN